MSNVNWITFKQPRTIKEVEASLRAIITKRFGNPDRLVYRGNGYWDYDDVLVCGENIRHGVSINTKGKKKVEFKSGATIESDWMEFVLRNELGVLFDGTCGGEYDEDASWKPDPTKFPTFDAYFKKFYG